MERPKPPAPHNAPANNSRHSPAHSLAPSQMDEDDVFESLGDAPAAQGPPYPTDDIEAALARAEALLVCGSGEAESWLREDGWPHQSEPWEQQQDVQQPWEWPAQHTQPWGAGPGDTAAGEAVGEPPLQPRPQSAFSLGETAMSLRLTVHEKQMELLQLRARNAQLTVGTGRLHGPSVGGCRHAASPLLAYLRPACTTHAPPARVPSAGTERASS